MGYRSLQQCVADLEASGRLVRIQQPVDPHLEAAAIHRRVFQAGGPAVFYANVRGTRFPMVSNLFGTIERARYIFRDTLADVRRLIDARIEPVALLRQPGNWWRVGRSALTMVPRAVARGPILAGTTSLDALPQVQSWPDDGGAFITLPQVYTEDAAAPGMASSNLGMYRIQISGGQYERNREVGMHYQIHRGIGVHHSAALREGVEFRANIFVGGPPAMNVAAVMPLPEGLSELRFAGALGGRRVRMVRREGQLPIHADADFCICGTVDPDRLLPEGPFGDHLGYYSLAHDFPVLRVEVVYHRTGAVWPFTVVGRPPQEDTIFGQLIHELTGPIIPTVLPGVRAVHAVDAAGVHPLLLAVGSERYVPYGPAARPAELLTQANALFGQGQLSLAKYLWIARAEEDSRPDIDQVDQFLMHILRRVDWRRDVHFQTCTTIDTLDYSGTALNEGSKVAIAAVGPPRRDLPIEIPAVLRLPDGFGDPQVAFPGALLVQGPSHELAPTLDRFCQHFADGQPVAGFPLVVVVDDSHFSAESLRNFLWVTFTRSNPAADIYGTGTTVVNKHWGCTGSLVIDARVKSHHAPPLVEDQDVERRVDALGAAGGPLHGVI